MKKKIVLSILVCTILVIASLTTLVSAAEVTGYATVIDITNEDTKHEGGEVSSSITDNGKETIVVTYNVADLKIIGEGTSGAAEGRPAGYAWLGIRITPPTNATKYKINAGDDEVTISDGQVDQYFGVNYDKLKEATETGEDIVYTATYNWLSADDDTGVTQTIKVIIKANGVELYDEEDTDEVWNESIYEAVKTAAEERNKVPADEPVAEKDNTPKTGVSDTGIVVAIAILVISLSGIVISKKH